MKKLMVLVFSSLIVNSVSASQEKLDPYFNLVGPFIEEIEVNHIDLMSSNNTIYECEPSESEPEGVFSLFAESPWQGTKPQRPQNPQSPENPQRPITPGDISKELDDYTLIVDKIINIGEKVWKIVEAGRPVSNRTEVSASALPSGTQCWMDLENWQIPVRKVYGVSYKNAYGMTVVKFEFAIDYTYGGTVNNIGSYLTNVTVTSNDLRVAWGYNFDAQVEIPTVINMGTRTDPVAGMRIVVKWKTSTPINIQEGTRSFFVSGKGDFQKL